MEIRKLGENQVRCALTEDEIRAMGFEVEEIVSDGETTQRFMRDVLGRVEQEGHIDLEHVAPMVRAELLQDHSMTITFGMDMDMNFQALIARISQLLSQIDPERLEEYRQMDHDERMEQMDAIIDELRQAAERDGQLAADEPFEPFECVIRFDSFDDLAALAAVCGEWKLPHSELYRLDGKYCIILDFSGFTKSEMLNFMFATIEYYETNYTDAAMIAHLREHGECIAKKDVLQMLAQL